MVAAEADANFQVKNAAEDVAQDIIGCIECETCSRN